ncbi:MAG: hypothetical protein M1828_005645 [Chrysothrix sp. TS-e1954]|nr:MAG: hypothetical protein M1828_005645 [Chrysothrix sp. TS-e1954]
MSSDCADNPQEDTASLRARQERQLLQENLSDRQDFLYHVRHQSLLEEDMQRKKAHVVHSREREDAAALDEPLEPDHEDSRERAAGPSQPANQTHQVKDDAPKQIDTAGGNSKSEDVPSVETVSGSVVHEGDW